MIAASSTITNPQAIALLRLGLSPNPRPRRARVSVWVNRRAIDTLREQLEQATVHIGIFCLILRFNIDPPDGGLARKAVNA